MVYFYAKGDPASLRGRKVGISEKRGMSVLNYTHNQMHIYMSFNPYTANV